MSQETRPNAVAGNEVVIREGVAADLPDLAPLWTALYEHQTAHGMRLTLPADAFAKWQLGMAPMLGRFTCLVIAEHQGSPIGFVAARIRPHAPYLGGGNAGYVSEVFVDNRLRGQRVGSRLLDATIAWFAKRDVLRIELIVISGNQEGLDFYRRLGWIEEHRQLVWDANAHSPGTA